MITHPTTGRPLYVKGLRGTDLLAGRCPCGELNVYGFWPQLEKTFRPYRLQAVARLRCRGCGRVRLRTYHLTVGGENRVGLFNWVLWYTWLMVYLPRYLPRWRWLQWLIFSRRAVAAVIWLDRKVWI
jgi:hypothetical protein